MQESKRQFSLAYLLLEIFWVGAALGLFRVAAYTDYHINPLLLLPAIVATGAAGHTFCDGCQVPQRLDEKPVSSG